MTDTMMMTTIMTVMGDVAEDDVHDINTQSSVMELEEQPFLFYTFTTVLMKKRDFFCLLGG